jgi:hypothetical protein
MAGAIDGSSAAGMVVTASRGETPRPRGGAGRPTSATLGVGGVGGGVVVVDAVATTLIVDTLTAVAMGAEGGGAPVERITRTASS